MQLLCEQWSSEVFKLPETIVYDEILGLCDFFENFLDFLLQTGKGYVMRVNDFKNEVKITPLLTPINALTATIVINRENSTRQ